jgi:hypothetical protein
VISLQHDGIVGYGLPDGMTCDDVATKLSQVATEGCGYQVVVEAKPLDAASSAEPKAAAGTAREAEEQDSLGLPPLVPAPLNSGS